MSESEDMDEYANDEPETFIERIEGIGDELPVVVKKVYRGGRALVHWTLTSGLSFARNAVWIGATTTIVMFLPYIIEKERSDMEKSQKREENESLKVKEMSEELKMFAGSRENMFRPGDRGKVAQQRQMLLGPSAAAAAQKQPIK